MYASNGTLWSIAQASDRRGVEDARVAILGKKGELTLAQTGMKDVPREEKPAVGQLLNEAPTAGHYGSPGRQAGRMQALADKAAVAGVDLTLPARSLHLGEHPLTIVRDEAVRILRHMGFALADGPEIEDEFHCFDALNRGGIIRRAMRRIRFTLIPASFCVRTRLPCKSVPWKSRCLPCASSLPVPPTATTK